MMDLRLSYEGNDLDKFERTIKVCLSSKTLSILRLLGTARKIACRVIVVDAQLVA